MPNMRTQLGPGYTSDDFVQVGDPIDGQAVGQVTPAPGTFTTLKATADLLTSAHVGTLATVTGLTAVERGTPYAHITEFIFNAVTLNVTHAGGTDGYGALKIYDFPAKALGRFGCRFALTAVGSSGGVSATSSFVIALGTAQQTAAGTSLVANGDNFSAGGAAITLSGGTASNITTVCNVATTLIDGVGTARALYLNLAAGDTSANGAISLTGSMHLCWIGF